MRCLVTSLKCRPMRLSMSRVVSHQTNWGAWPDYESSIVRVRVLRHTIIIATGEDACSSEFKMLQDRVEVEECEQEGEDSHN